MTTQNGRTRAKTPVNGSAPKNKTASPEQLMEALQMVTATAAQLEQQVNFWKQKYFEQLLHSTQVIANLNAPMLVAAQQHAERAAQLAAAAPTT